MLAEISSRLKWLDKERWDLQNRIRYSEQEVKAELVPEILKEKERIKELQKELEKNPTSLELNRELENAIKSVQNYRIGLEKARFRTFSRIWTKLRRALSQWQSGNR